MKSFVATLFVLGCALASANAIDCQQEYPGDGSVLDEDGNYKNNSVLVWKGMAECMKKMATQSGNQTMDEWMEATDDFNIAMQNGDIKRASKDLDLANACFAKAQYQMLNEDMGEFIGQVHYDFSKKLASGDMSAINQFMKEKKPQFDEEIAQA